MWGLLNQAIICLLANVRKVNRWKSRSNFDFAVKTLKWRKQCPRGQALAAASGSRWRGTWPPAHRLQDCEGTCANVLMGPLKPTVKATQWGLSTGVIWTRPAVRQTPWAALAGCEKVHSCLLGLHSCIIRGLLETKHSVGLKTFLEDQ